MYKYKIVASDLDGTLFDNNSRLGKRNAEAIRELTEKGIHFVPSTGRTYCDISLDLRNNENVRYYICSNGALVYDKKTGKTVKNGVESSLLKKTLDILYDYDVHLAIRTGGECVTDAEKYTYRDFADYNLCEAHIDVLKNFAKAKEGFKEYLYGVEDAEALAAFFKSTDDLFECKSRLEALGGLSVVRQFEYNLDIYSLATNKGDALLALADMVGAAPSETIGVGDSDNDVSLIKAAALGLAVSNASQGLKDVADEVICSNEEDSLAYINEHYFS